MTAKIQVTTTIYVSNNADEFSLADNQVRALAEKLAANVCLLEGLRMTEFDVCINIDDN